MHFMEIKTSSVISFSNLKSQFRLADYSSPVGLSEFWAFKNRAFFEEIFRVLDCHGTNTNIDDSP